MKKDLGSLIEQALENINNDRQETEENATPTQDPRLQNLQKPCSAVMNNQLSQLLWYLSKKVVPKLSP